MTRIVYRELASAFEAYQNCIASGNDVWRDRHEDKVNLLCEDYLPHGSGFDSGTTFDWEQSRVNRIILHTEYHHMDECGGYDGWSEHDVIVTPGWYGPELRITGRDRDGIKDYMYDVFRDCLEEEVRND